MKAALDSVGRIVVPKPLRDALELVPGSTVGTAVTAPIARDTSVAIPVLVQTHRAHPAVVRWWGDREIVLSGHAVAEPYSVLTRLPGDRRVAPADAARLLDEHFARPLLLNSETAKGLPDVLSRRGLPAAPSTTRSWHSPPRSTSWPRATPPGGIFEDLAREGVASSRQQAAERAWQAVTPRTSATRRSGKKRLAPVACPAWLSNHLHPGS